MGDEEKRGARAFLQLEKEVHDLGAGGEVEQRGRVALARGFAGCAQLLGGPFDQRSGAEVAETHLRITEAAIGAGADGVAEKCSGMRACKVLKARRITKYLSHLKLST